MKLHSSQVIKIDDKKFVLYELENPTGYNTCHVGQIGARSLIDCALISGYTVYEHPDSPPVRICKAKFRAFGKDTSFTFYKRPTGDTYYCLFIKCQAFHNGLAGEFQLDAMFDSLGEVDEFVIGDLNPDSDYWTFWHDSFNYEL